MDLERKIKIGLKIVCNPLIQWFLHKIFGINPKNFKMRFVKEDKQWYADIKHWPKRYHANLAMICGADRMLDELSDGKDSVKICVRKDEFPGAWHLTKIEEDFLGGTYVCDKIDYTIWLCNVTKFVFGEHPENIYIKKN